MRPALWLQWVLSFVVAGAVILGLVRFVESNTANQVTTENASGEAQANREAEILVAEDETPHTVLLPAHTVAAVAVNRAIRADITTMIDQGSLDGPLQHSKCSTVGYSGEVNRDALRGERADYRLQCLSCACRAERACPRYEVGAKALLEALAVAHRDHHDERGESGDDPEDRGGDQPRARGSMAAHGENR